VRFAYLLHLHLVLHCHLRHLRLHASSTRCCTGGCRQQWVKLVRN
jgi:hypothetical protein